MAVDIDSLQIEIEATSSDAASKIDQLATALTNLKSAAKGGAGLTAVTNQLNKLKSALSGINENSKALNELSSMMKNVGGGASGASSAISSVARTARTAKVDYSSLSDEVKSAAKAFADLPAGVQASVNAISRAKDAINGLNANKTTVSLEEAGQSLDDFRKSAAEASSILGKLKSVFRSNESSVESMGAAYASLPKQIRQAISANAALENSNKKTANSFGILGTGISSAQVKFGVYLIAFRQIASVMSDWVKESNDYVENLNLFTVAMGEYAEEAKTYAEEVHAIMGIDPSEWMRNQGVFMQMAAGFGVATDSAALMSKNLTQLGYDISSFYNIGIEEAMEKLQSGLAGEIEPLRRLGYAIDVASLEQVALNHGITESVNAMSQAEKSQLRYIAIMEQSSNAMGDLSRTIQTPANAMRILNQQIVQLRRALGNMLIPILQQVIPWVQAFVEVITEAIQALAVLFGFELPTIDYSGLDGVSVGASEAEDAIGGATDAAKKMKRELLGIDELTILEPNAASGAGGAGGVGGAGGDLGLDLPEYDFLNGLTDQTNELKDTVKDLLYNYIIPVGTALTAWKILDLIQGLGVATSLIKDLKKAVAGGIVAYLEFQLALGAFNDFFSEGGDIWDLVRGALVVALGSRILYAMFGGPGLIIGLGIGLVAMVVSLTSAIANGLDYNGVKSSIGTSLIAGLGGAIGWLATKTTAGFVIGFSLATAIQFNLTSIAAHLSGQVERGGSESILLMLRAAFASGVAGTGIGFMIGGPAGAAIGFVIGASLSIIGQNVSIDFGEWYQETSKIIDGIEVLDDRISEATKNTVGPFLEQLQELDDSMANLRFTGTVIDDSVLTDTQLKVDTIVSTLVNGLDASKNEALATLEPLASILGEEKYNEILLANQNYYAQAKSDVLAGEAEISAIMQNAASQNRAITEDEWQQIRDIESEMQELGVSNLSETQIEYETIMRNLKDNAAHISLEQASEIIKNAQSTRDETIAAAETQYSTVLLEAQKMLDTGAINDEQYQAIIDAAKESKDSTIADAEEQYNSIYNTASTKLGDLARYIDENTGEIKSKWQVFWDDVGLRWSNFWSGINQGWQDFKSDISAGWTQFWEKDLPNAVAGGVNGIISGVETGLNWVIDKLNSFKFTTPSWLPFGMGGKSFGLNIPKISLGRVSFFESGGFPDYGEMFIARENGPELVGRIGNRTAVANNDQIVEGIASANDGVVNAILAGVQQIVRAIEENGGDIYVESDGTATQNRRNRMYGKTLQYI